MHFVGYVALKRLYDLPDVPHHVVSHIVKAARRTVGNQEYYPTIYAPENSPAGHVEFALKYEGVNLAILSALFRAIDNAELVAYIQSRPTGIHTRVFGFSMSF